MSLFPDTIAADLAGKVVQCCFLVKFDFTTEPVRLWIGGNGKLTTNDGQVWSGLGQFGAVSGVEQAVNGDAPEMSFTLSGIDAQIMRLAKDEFEAEVKGRLVYVLLQFFGVDDPDDPDNQRPLDLPYPITAARCLKPEFQFAENGERSVTVKAESLFSLRSRPRWSMYTDADQQRRFPGDKGFEFVSSLVNKVVTWPDY
ncbi:hypothetical protein [Novosphingobium huizhouense]|uniref:hypothetical protein n=1 Tax=Novosphingobium huizhouense TaxID=2866625 RepID=UPI001CD8AA78|nr:hypothetical protein [Novosphingobium huizhouense]